LSGLRVYLQFTWEVGLPSSNKRPCSWLLGVPRSRQSLSSPPGSFIYSPGKDSLPPIFALAQACLWGNRSIAKLTWSASSHAIWAPATGGPGGLLGSPFNVKWRFSAPAGDVEESKLCLFSVIMPAKCVSSVSPRFHYRRVAFCFLPLAAILEFPSFHWLYC
jgi:hypothetical protein